MIMWLYLALGFLFIWQIMYGLCATIYKRGNPECISRVVAFIHAFTICRLIEWNMFFVGPWFFEYLAEKNTDMQNLIMCISCGYFIFDTAWCLHMKMNDKLLILHHMISVVAFVYSLYYQTSASEILLTTWGSEITNPFFQIRWFLRETGNNKSKFAFFNDMTFSLLFLFVRNFVGGILLYISLFTSKMSLFVKVGAVCFYIINFLWMLQILQFAKKKLFAP